MANEKIYVGETGAKELYRKVKGLIPTDVPGDGKLKVQLGNSQAVDTGFTANTDDDHTLVIGSASTSAQGVVQLSNAIDSSSETNAATSKAVKDAYDALDAKMKARAVFFGSVAEWNTYKAEHPEGDPSKVYYVQTGSGEDKYTVYVWKVVPDGESFYEETDESSISLEGYWHDSPTVVDDPNNTDTFVSDIALNQNGTVSVTRKTVQHVKSDWTAAAGSVSEILNKPNLATVATTGSYNDLLDKPVIPPSVDSWKQWSIDHGSTGNSDSVYIGKNNSLSALDSIVVGHLNSIIGQTEVSVFGYNNTLTNSNQNLFVAGRYNTLNKIIQGVIVGSDNKFTGTSNNSQIVVVGNSNTGLVDDDSGQLTAGTAYQTAIIGMLNKTTDVDLAASVGYNNSLSHSRQCVVFGCSNNITESYRSSLFGFESSLQGTDSTALGTGVIVSGNQSVVVGVRAKSGSITTGNSLSGYNNVVLGVDAQIIPDGTQFSGGNVLVGTQSTIAGNANQVVGHTTVTGNNNIVMAYGGNITGDFNTIFGQIPSSSTFSRSLVLGDWNVPKSNSITVGACSYIGNNSMSIGFRNDSKNGDHPNAITVGYDNLIINSVDTFGGIVPSQTLKEQYPASPITTETISIPAGSTNITLTLDGTLPSTIQSHEYKQFTGPTTEGEFYLFRDVSSSSYADYYCYARGASGAARTDYRIKFKASPTSTYYPTVTPSALVNGNWEMFGISSSAIQCPETFVLQKKVDGQFIDLPTSKLLGIIDVNQMELFDYSVICLNGTDNSYLISIRLPSYRKYTCTINYEDGTSSDPIDTGVLSSPPRFNYKPVKSSGVAVTGITIVETGTTGFIPQPTPPNYEDLYFATNMYYTKNSSITYKSDLPVNLSYTKASQYISNIQTVNTAVGVHNSIQGHNGTAIGTYNIIDTPTNETTFSTAIGTFNKIAYDDDTDYYNTYVTSIGQYNTATNAANAYQFGRDNTITGNNLEYAETYPHSLSVNIGRNNTITGEGLNLGKDNTSTTFGITLGQDISASSGSISIGRSIKDTTYTTGTTASGGSISIGFNAVASSAAIAIGSNTSAGSATTASGSSIAIGATSTVSGGSYSFGLNNTVAGGSVAVGTNNTLSTGANAYAFGNNNTVKNFAFVVGRNNTVGNDTNTSYNLYAFGANNTVPNGEAFVVGCFNTTPSNNGVGKINVFGYSNSATGSVAQIFGYNNTNVNCAVALGISNSDINGHSVAVGIDNKAQGEAMAFGKGNTAYSGSVSLGVNNKVSASGTAGVCAGKGNTIVSGGYNVALGTENYANLEAISIGSRNDVSGWSFAYGVENRTERVNGSHALLLGMYNESSSNKEHLNWEVPTSMDTSEFLPTRVVRGYTFSEQIIPITALENQGGSVTRIRFNYTVTHKTVRTFEVYVGETSKTVFDTSSDWIPVSSLTKVYDGEVTFHLQGDRTAIEFTTPFNLSNGKNLVFALYDKTGTPADYTIPFNIIKTNANTALLMWSDTEFTLGNLPSGAKTNAISLIDVTIDGYNISTYDSVFIGDMPETSSILLGARNQSRHHNSILLGYGNRSYRPLPVPQGQLYDDDDGFIVAIGRENRVGRNYDTAIGCKSIANGGHALAIGSYLEANPWQSVIGYYNKSITGDKDGANEYRSSKTYSVGMYSIHDGTYYKCKTNNTTGAWNSSNWINEAPVAFVVGTGYTKADDTIVRKNALELYANGDLKVTGDITANNIPAAPTTDGEYMLKCSVSNGTKTYTWVAMNTATVV